MQLKVFIFKFILLAGILVVLDILVLDFYYEIEQNNFLLNKYFVLILLTFLSSIVVGISYHFYRRNFDIIGYVFLGITFFKMFVLLFVGKPLMTQNNIISIEKTHFIFLFFIFLLLETYMTIDLLNTKPNNSKSNNSKPPNPKRE